MNEQTNLSKKSGLPPGTLIHIGKKRANKVLVSVIDYSETIYNEVECKTIDEAFSFKDTTTTSWINIDGIHNTELIEVLGTHFGHHPLLMEDIVNTLSRPKLEEFDDGISYYFSSGSNRPITIIHLTNEQIKKLIKKPRSIDDDWAG